MVLDKPEMPVNTLVEIWNRLKYKRSSPQTQRSCRIELVSETPALCEMSKEMKMDLEEERTKQEPRKENCRQLSAEENHGKILLCHLQPHIRGSGWERQGHPNRIRLHPSCCLAHRVTAQESRG